MHVIKLPALGQHFVKLLDVLRALYRIGKVRNYIKLEIVGKDYKLPRDLNTSLKCLLSTTISLYCPSVTLPPYIASPQKL